VLDRPDGVVAPSGLGLLVAFCGSADTVSPGSSGKMTAARADLVDDVVQPPEHVADPVTGYV